LDTDENGGEYFTLFIPRENPSCEEGKLTTVKDTSEMDLYYSIDNKILTITQWYDTVQFKGSGNELVDTWTRKKGSKDSSCEPEYEGALYLYCKNNYDITKAVFTDSKVTITREECYTDKYVNGYVNEWNGYTTNVKDCNTLEYSNGSEKITKTLSKTGEKISYKNKVVCEYAPTKDQQKAACEKAWEDRDDDYEWILRKDYINCQNENLPEDFTGYGGDEGGDICIDEDGDSCLCDDMCVCYDYEEYEWYNYCGYEYAGKPAISAKPLAKAFKAKAKTSKLKPLLKK